MAKRGRPRHPDILTPREWQVLALLREGLSNEQIGERLGITERTAKYHVSEILSKLGLSSREEAATWAASGAEERRPWWLAAAAPVAFLWRKASFGLSPATAAVLGITAAAGVGLLVWGLLRTGRDGEQLPGPSAGLIVAINDNAPADLPADSLVSVLDARMRHVIGTIRAGYRPWAVLRPSERQLLVSQMFGSGSVDGPSLRVFDLDNLATPVREIAMPGRVAETIYSPAGALSGNEQFLYYPSIRSICPQGGDTSVCDIGSVVVIDLEQGREMARTDMPLGCGFPQLTPVGEQDVWALCPGGTLRRVRPDGEITEELNFPGRYYVSPGTAEDGAVYMLYRDGTVRQQGDPAGGTDVLPSDEGWVGFQTFRAIGHHRVMFLFGERNAHSYRNLLVFDTGDPTQVESFQLPRPALQVEAVDSGTVALLAEDGGTLTLFNLATGSVVGEVSIPSGARWLAGG